MNPILQYIFAYIVLGIPCVLFVKWAMTDNQKHKRGDWITLLVFWVFWPIWIIVSAVWSIVRAIAWMQVRQCMWCGQIVKYTPEASREHALICEEHPLREKYNLVEK